LSQARYSVRFGDFFYAQSPTKNGLLNAIKNEGEKWKLLIPSMEVKLNRGAFGFDTLSLNYDEFYSFVDSRITADTPKLISPGNTRDRRFCVLPVYESFSGRILVSLFKSGARGQDDFGDAVGVIWQRSSILPIRQINGNQDFLMHLTNGHAIVATFNLANVDPGRASMEQQILDAKSTNTDIVAIKDDAEEQFDHLKSYIEEAGASSRDELAKISLIRRKSIGRYKKSINGLIESWDKTFKEIQDQYENQLQYRSSVKLWSNAEVQHKKNSFNAFISFILVLLATIFVAAAIVIKFGDSIAASFHERMCILPHQTVCVDRFSAKGPLTIGMILLTFSMAIWIMKILNKNYRDERRMAAASRERKAFTETFLAMTESKQMSPEHTAIVLNALFRPTTDDKVTDDHGGLELSSAALLAKAISGRAP
jgi:hypothetical protein